MNTTPTPLNIGRTPQLFFDNHVIEMVNFVARRMHRPERHPQNPLVVQDRPYEKVVYIRESCSIHWDDKERLFKFWYEDIGWDYEAFMGRGKSSDMMLHHDFHNTTDNRVLYAESTDGLQWDKPELGYRTIDGRDTNVCFGNEEYGKVHASTVLLDPLETDAARRYKVVYWTEKTNIDDARIAAAYSADGRRWTPYEPPMIIGGFTERQLGDVIKLTRDPVGGDYFLDTRLKAMQEVPLRPHYPTGSGWGDAYFPGDPWGMSKRRIYSATGPDVNEWPLLREMLVPDDLDDGLDVEFYGLVRFFMGDLHLGLLNIFHRTDNVMDVRLIYSRDGHNWNRVDRGNPFLELGSDGQWDCYMTEVFGPPLFLDDEIRVYYAGANRHHDWWQYGEMEGLDVPEVGTGWESGLGLATLRPEGFVSLDTTVREGIVVTRPFVTEGSRLSVNAECRDGGYLDVELAGADDMVVPGFERSACDTFRADSTRHAVSWEGNADLPGGALAKGAKLRFYSRHCDLYSFRIT